MKKILFLLLVAVSSMAHADDTAKRISYKQLLIPLDEPCQQYYSLNPPSKICIKGEYHFRAYEVVYEVRGQYRFVRLTYIPGNTFKVDQDGVVKQRNHSIAPDQRF